MHHQKLHRSLYNQQDAISIDSHKTPMVSGHCLNSAVRVFLIMTVKLDFIDLGTKLQCSLNFFQNFCVNFVYGPGTSNICQLPNYNNFVYSCMVYCLLFIQRKTTSRHLPTASIWQKSTEIYIAFRNLFLLRQLNHCTQHMTLRLSHWV